MIQVENIESTEQLGELKQQYIQQTTGPLDGMWLCGFVPMASHYGFYEQEKLVGYCCVNDDGYLLQFLLSPRCQNQSSQLLESILQADSSPTGKINGAFVSTAEPRCLSLCLDHFSAFEVHALMYQLDKASEASREQTRAKALAMTAIDSAQLTEVVEFAMASIGAPADWHRGYFANLIDRRELFGLWENGRLLATGESRGYDQYQTDYADLGVIVAVSERGRGLATQVLKQLVTISEAKGLKSICSTEKTNVAAQIAISRAGFFAHNRIIKFDVYVPR